MQLLRRLRGALGVGLTWAVAWGGIFAGLAFLAGLIDPSVIDAGEGPLAVAPVGAVFGFVSGIGFSVLLSISERRRTLASVSLGRAAVWGALGTAMIPLLTPVSDSMVILVCPLGAALAAASVVAARKALPLLAAQHPVSSRSHDAEATSDV